MTNKKISGLTSATTPLAGTEVLPIVQSGATVKVANNDLRPKQIQSNATSGVLQIAGPTASQTRVMTTPDANFTVARTDAAQTFAGVQTFPVIGGKNYSPTSGSGGTQITNTGITWNTTDMGYGDSAVYEMYVVGNQNAGGNVATNVCVGLVIVGVGYTGTTFNNYISYTSLANPTMGSTSQFTPSAVFWDGATETTNAPRQNTSYQIRIKVAGYQSGYELYGSIYLNRRL